MENGSKNMLDSLTDLEIEKILNECGFKYEKVEKGKGGLFVDENRITAKDIEKVSLFNQNNS